MADNYLERQYAAYEEKKAAIKAGKKSDTKKPSTKFYTRPGKPKALIAFVAFLSFCTLQYTAKAQGWPENYSGVMLQGFSWDDYDNTRWVEMESQADELAQFFSLVWIPQSGNCGGKSMGYNPLYYFNHNSSFGTEDELRSMIKTFKAKGIGTIADVVINHRNTLSGWFDFPKETYKGTTYQMYSTDVCADDDGGKAANEAKNQGVELSPNKDSGEGWDGFRDIDHASENVQKNIFAYEDFLLNDLGYTGFRYDVAKGFDAKYFGMYNAKAQPEFSVGECWDSSTAIKRWMEGTRVDGKIQSGAFDFQFRYRIRDAFNNKNYATINGDTSDQAGYPLIYQDAYRRYAITFAENHDMQDRGNVTNYTKDPIPTTYVPAANATILAMPGTPCVFQPHWLKHKAAIKKMILARKAAGITNTSKHTVHEASTDRFMVECGDLLAVIGKSDNATAKSLGFSLVTNGTSYYYYLRNSLETVFISEPSGTFNTAQTPSITVELYAVSADEKAKIIYTLNGTEPIYGSKSSYETGASTKVKISENTTLKVGLLMADGTVKNVQTRTYNFTTPPPFEVHDATIYVKPDFSPVYFYIWDSNNNSQLNGSWPGKQMDNDEKNWVEIDGERWLKQTIHISEAGYYFNIIFNQGKDKPQTNDIMRVSSDRYFIATISGNTVVYKDVTSQHTTSIVQPTTDGNLEPGIHSIDGRLIIKNVSSDETFINLPRGFYIINGKKVYKQ